MEKQTLPPLSLHVSLDSENACDLQLDISSAQLNDWLAKKVRETTVDTEHQSFMPFDQFYQQQEQDFPYTAYEWMSYFSGTTDANGQPVDFVKQFSDARVQCIIPLHIPVVDSNGLLHKVINITIIVFPEDFEQLRK